MIDDKNIRLFECYVFFVSIQIFQYLVMNKTKFIPSLCLYAIHSKNAELIYLLESNEVPAPKKKKKKNG